MKITEVKKKDGSIVYRANIYLGVDNITGKKVKTSVTGRTKKEVSRKAQNAQLDFKINGSTVYKTVQIESYKELAELWLESYKLTVKPQTYRNTTLFLKNHLLPMFGDMRLEKITPHIVQRFINRLAVTLANFRVPVSINSRILQYAVTLQLIPYNPARDVILPPKPAKDPQKITFIDKQDLKKLLDYVEKISIQHYTGYFDMVLYKTLLATGCRIGELLALNWSDIDFKEKTLNISKTYNGEMGLIGTTKSKAGNRTISVDTNTLNMLRLYNARQRQMFSEIGAPRPSVVFSAPTRLYQLRTTIQRRLDDYCHTIDIPRFTLHAFRHTHASLLLNAGISYKELQYRLGHANISMTLDVYSHLSKDKEKEAVTYYEKAINNL
ncbi:tyrosine-type recombinase/integrase [Streptococcus marmotae]|uniref:tyrosine-type recombinase/integrase n=1 Tax=Streptococcus marmotae TaxID=1825069 RepID=UPI0008367A43|nr:site-specific integrase [Streptococcus marmotae]